MHFAGPELHLIGAGRVLHGATQCPKPTVVTLNNAHRMPTALHSSTIAAVEQRRSVPLGHDEDSQFVVRRLLPSRVAQQTYPVL
jgi:hypothetical protein